MAERRMFSKTIIDSDNFIDMPLTTQALYFHLAMRADDDGFVNNPKKIQRMVCCTDDDMRLLIAKQFVIPFDNGICVIRHWKIHNYIRNDRYKPTIYLTEKSMLASDENGLYIEKNIDGIPIDNQNVYQMETQDRLGKDRLDKDNISLSISPNEKIDCGGVVELYNSICISLPRVKSLTDTRRKAIKAAFKILGSIESFKKFFETVEKSDFLCGRTDKPWSGCGFDWILKKSNLVKIIEGQYNNRSQGKNNQPDYSDVSRYENIDPDWRN